MENKKSIIFLFKRSLLPAIIGSAVMFAVSRYFNKDKWSDVIKTTIGTFIIAIGAGMLITHIFLKSHTLEEEED